MNAPHIYFISSHYSKNRTGEDTLVNHIFKLFVAELSLLWKNLKKTCTPPSRQVHLKQGALLCWELDNNLVVPKVSLGSFEQPEPKYTLYQHIPFFLPVIKSLRRNRIVRICSLSFGPYVLVKMFQIKCVSVEFVSIVYSDILQSHST